MFAAAMQALLLQLAVNPSLGARARHPWRTRLLKQCLNASWIMPAQSSLNRFCLIRGVTNIGRRGQGVQFIFYCLRQLQ